MTGAPEATRSVCPECLAPVPARRVTEGDDVHLEKTCPVHGFTRAVVWRGAPARAAWVGAASAAPLRDDCPAACAACDEHASATCCALLEVTRRCNLRCPVCFAAAGEAAGDPPLAALVERLGALRARAGACTVQLSGGEPTMRDDLPELVMAARRLGFGFVQLNTNGLRLAQQPGYAQRLRDAGLGCVFLQFDGLDDAVHRALRGAPLAALKAAAVARCAVVGLGIVLVPTVVPGVNDGQLGAIVDTALRLGPVVRGVHVQPVSWFGRFPRTPRDADRITLPEVMRALDVQTKGRVPLAAFRPPSSEHAACSFHASFRRTPGGGLEPVKAAAGCCGRGDGKAAARAASQAVAGRWTHPAPAGRGGATAALDDFVALERAASFTVSGMAFQDAWTLDLERLRRCHVHVEDGPGRLVPFCAYNLTSREGTPLHRLREAS